MLSPLEQTLLFLRLPKTGAATYWQVLTHFPSLQALFETAPHKLEGLLKPQALTALAEHHRRGPKSPLLQQVRTGIAAAKSINVELLSTEDEHYPELLKQSERPPPILYVQGDLSCLSLPQIAMVGSRKASAAGTRTAHAFAAELAANGFAITSGLAIGIDSAAHAGALSVKGRTIAVLGTGLDRLYPKRNRLLAQEIIDQGGALVSEFPLGTDALPQNFPRRNRIISALAYGTLIIEAAIKSGSLITARYALQQDRELFAIPGSIHDPLSKGCHALIKDGAKLVETAQDIVDEFNGFLALKWQQLDHNTPAEDEPTEPSTPVNDTETTILSHLGYEPTSVDTLCERTRLPVSDLMASLLTLELKGIVDNAKNGYKRAKHG